MPRFSLRLSLRLATACLALAASAAGARAQTVPVTALPTETPANFTPDTSSFDYVRRTAMIPMRDGVKLFTVIIIPKAAHHAPMLLTRTPYGADDREAGRSTSHLSALIGQSDAAGELVASGQYIRVLQDIRGKHRSEGDYVMTRPLIGPLNPTKVDHATDTYDTIDWLVKNVPESNGKVGILGISYDGFTSLMALVHPHPALRAAMPINPMVDGWKGDDWFHNGAFRQSSLNYAYDQEATRDSSETWWSDNYDDYASWLNAGSAGNMAKLHGLTFGFAQKLMAHPAYDAFWQDQAMDKILAKEPLQVPVMLVDSLWDQEDIYGALHVYAALKPKDTDNSKVFLIMGPWFHHQLRLDGSSIGPLQLGNDTTLFIRKTFVKAFFDNFLLDNPPAHANLMPVVAFQTGTNRWMPLRNWPPCAPAPSCGTGDGHLYLAQGGHLATAQPPDSKPGYDEYTSDPAKPVPFLPRPIHIDGEQGEQDWQTWLVSDQREAASRTDVLSFETDTLTAPLAIAGVPSVNLVASTTGTDGDFVVKLIDVYPDEVGREPKMGGYQLMVSADIFRGRYRNDLAKPSAIPAGLKQTYKFDLPNANHVFLPGHRIMVQVQSSWFPLYDRNPQTYVDNIFFAKPEDYKKATIRVFDAGKDASFLNLPLLPQ